MTFGVLPLNVRQVAESILTAKQLEAFRYEVSGWGMMRIARQLGVTKGAVDSRIHGAHIKLHKAGVRQDAYGSWYCENEEAA